MHRWERDVMGLVERERRRLAALEARAERLAETERHPHGSVSRYRTGCRCPECGEAHRLENREWRAKRRAQASQRARRRPAPPELADTRWMADAACAEVDTAVFFPVRNESTAEAEAVCAQCPVREPCLAWALDHREEHGIWGGMSARARRRLLHGRAAGEDREAS